MNRTRWRGWLAAGAIFLLGFSVGGAGVALVGIRAFRQRIQAPADAPGLADRTADRIGADLTKSLRLSPEESARVQTILRQSAGNLKALRVKGAALAMAELHASTEKIAGTLPPEKHAAFYRLMAQRYERFGLPAPAAVPPP
jgi:hypothetical protein